MSNSSYTEMSQEDSEMTKDISSELKKPYEITPTGIATTKDKNAESTGQAQQAPIEICPDPYQCNYCMLAMTYVDLAEIFRRRQELVAAYLKRQNETRSQSNTQLPDTANTITLVYHDVPMEYESVQSTTATAKVQAQEPVPASDVSSDEVEKEVERKRMSISASQEQQRPSVIIRHSSTQASASCKHQQTEPQHQPPKEANDQPKLTQLQQILMQPTIRNGEGLEFDIQWEQLQ